MKASITQLARVSVALIAGAGLFFVACDSHGPTSPGLLPSDIQAGVSNATVSNATTCTGTYSGTTFAGDVVVPAGQTCNLEQFNVVVGGIRVERGATLIVCPDNDIGGDIEGHEPQAIDVTDMVGVGAACPGTKTLGINIGGDVRVNGGQFVRLIGNFSGGVAVIHGDIRLKNVQTVFIRFFNNQSRIGRDVHVKDATDVDVVANVIGGDLKIQGTSGTCVEEFNSVAGKTDTCP